MQNELATKNWCTALIGCDTELPERNVKIKLVEATENIENVCERNVRINE